MGKGGLVIVVEFEFFDDVVKVDFDEFCGVYFDV